MPYEWDTGKDAANRAKHGLSLAAADGFRWDTAIEAADLRRDYGEPRMIAIGFIGDRLHVMIYSPRGDARRVISLRKANDREVRRYERG